MATVPRSVTESVKHYFTDNFNMEDFKNALTLVYNAGYKKGLKARNSKDPVPEYQDAD